MNHALRLLVQNRAVGLCEGCRSPSNCSPGPFDVDHVCPRALNGTDEPDNYAWSCGGCNGHKGVKVSAPDPLSGEDVPLFHPRQHLWNEHFCWSADGLTLGGLTPTGRATVRQLQLNRAEVKTLREMLFQLGRHFLQEDAN